MLKKLVRRFQQEARRRRQSQRRHVARVAAESLESRLLLSSIYWTGNDSTGGGAWEDPRNWDLGRVPNAEDDVFIGARSGSRQTISIESDVVVASLNLGGPQEGAPPGADPFVQTLLVDEQNLLIRERLNVFDGGELVIDGGQVDVERTAFPSFSSTLVPHPALRLESGDFDADRRTDVITGGNGTVTLFRGDGFGGLTTGPRDSYSLIGPEFGYSVSTNSFDRAATFLVAGDLDQDGDLDILHGGVFVSSGGRRELVAQVLQNDNAEPGTFRGSRPVSIASLNSSTDAVTALTAADVNGDGLPDVIAVTHAGSGASTRNEAAVHTLKADGQIVAGTPLELRSIDPLGSNVLHVRTGDVTGNGLIDVVAHSNRGEFVVLEQQTSGSLREHSVYSARSAGPFQLADADGDRNLDLITTRGAHINDGRAGFSDRTTAPGGDETPVNLAVGDIDLDGDADIVAFEYNEIALTNVFTGNGKGDFNFRGWHELGYQENVADALLTDLNGDALPDLVIIDGARGLFTSVQPRVDPSAVTNSGLIDVKGHIDAGGTTRGGLLQVSGGGVQTSGSIELFGAPHRAATLRATGPISQSGGLTRALHTTVFAGGGFDLRGGTLEGVGRIVGNVVNRATVRLLVNSEPLTIDGDYTQTAAGTLQDRLEAIEFNSVPSPGFSATTADGIEFGQMIVTGRVSLGGRLDVAASGFTPQVGQQFPIVVGRASGAFAAENLPSLPAGRRWDTRINAAGMSLAVVEDAVMPTPDDTRIAFNSGVTALADSLSDLAAFFNITSFDLPVVRENLATLFGLGGPGGLLDQIGSTELRTLDSPVTTYAELRAQLDALAGYAVEFISGDAGGTPGDELVLRFTHTVSDLASSAEFHDTTNALLQQIAAAADLDGALDYTADLRLDFIAGVDANGFFLRGDSSIALDLTVGGSVQTMFDLSSFLGVTSGLNSTASADLDVVLSAGGESVRLRAGDLSSAGDYFSIAGSGTAGVQLEQQLQPFDLGWNGSWLMTVTNGTTSASADITFPTQSELLAAVRPWIEQQLEASLPADVTSLFSDIDLPLADESAGPPDAPDDQRRIGFPPSWTDLFAELWASVDVTANDEVISQLLTGQLPEMQELIRVTFETDTDQRIEHTSDYASDVSEFDGLSASLSGSAAIGFTASVNVAAGVDTSGFFIDSAAALAGSISGNAALSGTFAGLQATATGSITAAPSIALQPLDENSDGRIRLSEIAPNISRLQPDAGPVTADLQLELVSDLLDYIDADGNPNNNTIHGGDAFRFVASTTLTGSVTDDGGGLTFTWSGIDIHNPDVNGDGIDDFTSTVFVDNLRELARDVIRGDRTLLSDDLLAAFGLQSLPLVDALSAHGSLADGLQIAAALADAVLDSTETLYVLPFSDGDVPNGENDSLEDWLNNGLPSTTQELVRLKLDLGELALAVSDLLTFDLSAILPETSDITGRAGIENARLTGEIVFGLDTNVSPFYLLTAADALTPDASTTFGGEFDVFVNVSGEQLAGGVLSMENADARMSPRIQVALTGDADGKFRLGDDLTALAPVSVLLDGADVLTLTADRVSLSPGAFTLTGEDDDPLDDVPAVTGQINIVTGDISADVRRVTGGVAGSFDIDATGVSVQSGVNAQPDDPLFQIDTGRVTLTLLESSPVELTANDLRVLHSGEVTITRAEAFAAAGLGSSLGLAGILPVDVTRVLVEAVDVDGVPGSDPIRLSDFTARAADGNPVPVDIDVEGFFNASLFDALPFRPSLQIGGSVHPDGPDNTFGMTFRRTGNQIVPWNTGTIAMRLTDADVFEGFALDGSIALGGYVDGIWQAELGGLLTASLDIEGTLHAGLTVRILEGSTLDISTGRLLVDGEVELNAGMSGSIGGFTFSGGVLPFTMLLDVDRIPAAPFFDVATFSVVFGAITVEEIIVDLNGVMTLTARNLLFDLGGAADEPIASIGSIEIDVTALSGLEQTSFVATDARLYRDRLQLDSVELLLSGTVTIAGTDLLALRDLAVTFTNVGIGFEGADPLSGNPISISDISGFISGVEVDVATAVLLPDRPASEIDFDTLGEPGAAIPGLALVSGLLGTFDATGKLVITTDRLAADVLGVFEIEALDGLLTLGPNVAADETVFGIGTATLTIPLLDDREVALAARDLNITRDGTVSITSAAVTAADGLAASLGLAGILPFDLTEIRIDGVDNDGTPGPDPIALSVISGATSIDDLDISVRGEFDFSVFSGLPFTPVLQIGSQDAATPAAPRTFDVTFRVMDLDTPAPSIRIQDTGPITFGFRDFALGPFGIDEATITLGGYIGGDFQTNFGATVAASFDSDSLDVGGSVAVDAATSHLYLPDSAGNPNPGAATLDLDVDLAASLAIGSLADDSTDSGWGFAFENLAIEIGVQFAMRLDGTGFQFEPVGGLPLVTLNSQAGLSVDRVALELGGLLTLEATNVGVHFDAFRTDSSGRFTHVEGPFLTFGGVRPTKPAATDENPYPELEGGDGSISLAFGDAGSSSNPLAGLGGSAGNFGIGWDPDAAIGGIAMPLQFVQLEDFFVSVSIPEDFKFGLPDWLPVQITEIGLRFPDTFGDLMPTGGLNPGDGGQLASFAFDALTNFSLIFSGGMNSQQGGWPIRGLVENIEIDINRLAACAEHVWNNRETYAPQILAAMQNPDGSPNPAGTLTAMALIGLDLYRDPNCEFPITNLDAFDIGIEPFNLGPITIGGGLGLGLLDIDTDDDGIDDTTTLFGRIEGQFAYSDIGVGVELIVTQYGPVLARLFAGVPIPIGTLIGALVGSVVPGLGTAAGASVGTQTGFIMTGFQGGLVFDNQPLPVINGPNEILTNPDVRYPLDISLEDIREAAKESIVRGVPTWNNGFKFGASGTITNTHIHGLLGLRVDLGANIAFDIEELTDVAGNAVTAGSFQSSIDATQTLFEDPSNPPLAFQLYGFGEVEVIGQGFADSGILLDFSDPLNPKLDIAARLPSAGSLLGLLLPGEGTIGIELDTDGLAAGSVIAMKTFVDNVLADASSAFHGLLDDLAAQLQEQPGRPLSQVVLDGLPDGTDISGELLKTRLLEVFSNGANALAAGIGPESPIVMHAILAASEVMNAISSAADFGVDAVFGIVNSLVDAGSAAYDQFFDTINPSLTISGAIQPVLLGMPIGEPTEQIEVRIDKDQLHFDGRFRVLEKLLALTSVPLPLNDVIDVSVDVPFENLFRDLALFGVPQVDVTRDWRATFRATVSLLNVIELGDVAGLIFPAIEPGIVDPAEDADGNGIPDDHPLDTHVEVIAPGTDLSTHNFQQGLFGPEPRPGEADNIRSFNKIVVLPDDFETLKTNGGVLFDGRLTLPQFITDPFAWFAHLRGLAANLVTDENGDPLTDADGNPICTGLDNALECFLANPVAFLEFFGEFSELLAAEHQVAQVQMFVPNFFDELAGVIDVTDPDTVNQLRQALLSADFGALLDLLGQGTLDDLIQTLTTDSYFRGQIGNAPIDEGLPTTGKLLGIDLGGAVVQYADPNPGNGDNDERSLLVSVNFSGLDATFLIDANGAYPRIGAEIAVGSFANQTPIPPASQIVQLLEGIGFPFPVGDWLFPGSGSGSSVGNTAGAVLRAYTPGFSQSPGAPAIQRDGGLEVAARVSLNNNFGQFSGDLQFALGPDQDSASGWRASGSFSGYGSLTIPGLGTVAVGTPSNPALRGELTPEGLLVLDVGEQLSSTAYSGTIGFGAGAQMLLLMNLSDQDLVWDDPTLPTEDDPVIPAFGRRLAVDGVVRVGDVLVDGQFLFDTAGNQVTLAGRGSVDTGPFDLLLGVSNIDVTVAGGWRRVTATRAFGAMLFNAGSSFDPAASTFFSSDATFSVAFNNTLQTRTIDPSQFATGDVSAVQIPVELQPLLTLSPLSRRLFVAGSVMLGGFELDATFMAQSSPAGLDLYAKGQLDAGFAGTHEATGFARIAGPTSQAANFQLNSGANVPLLIDDFSLNGSLAFAANSTGANVSINLGPLLQVNIPSGPGGSSYSELSFSGTLSIPRLWTSSGSSSIGVSGKLQSTGTMELLATVSELRIGSAASSLIVDGTLFLRRQFEVPPFGGRPVPLTSFGGDDIRLRWAPFNSIAGNATLRFNIPLFRVTSRGRIAAEVGGATFWLAETLSGSQRMRLQTGSMFLDVNPDPNLDGSFSDAYARLELSGALLTVPGLFTGSNRLALPAFSLSTGTTFSVERDLNFSLGGFEIRNARLRFRRLNSGVIDIRVLRANSSVPVIIRVPNLFDANLNNFNIDSYGRFDLNVAAPQIGPSFLHIQDARLIVDKNSTSFSVRLDTGVLDLPIGPNIALPSLSFSSNGLLLPKNLSLSPSQLNFGTFFRRPPGGNNRQFTLSLTDGVLKLERPAGFSSFPWLALPGSSLALDTFVVRANLNNPAQRSFEVGLTGTLGIGDWTTASGSFLATLSGSVFRIEPVNPVNVNLGFMTVEMNGFAETDGDFSFTGTLENPAFLTPAGSLFRVTATISNSSFSASARIGNTTIGTVSRAGCVTLLPAYGGVSFPLPGASSHACEPEFSINDRSLTEGTSSSAGSTKNFTFTVTMSRFLGTLEPDIQIPVYLETDTSVPLDLRATIGVDVQAMNTVYLTFKKGEPRTKTVTVKVYRDSTFEADERFRLRLGVPKRVNTNQTYGIRADRIGIGTIRNDDAQPSAAAALSVVAANVSGAAAEQSVSVAAGRRIAFVPDGTDALTADAGATGVRAAEHSAGDIVRSDDAHNGQIAATRTVPAFNALSVDPLSAVLQQWSSTDGAEGRRVQPVRDTGAERATKADSRPTPLTTAGLANSAREFSAFTELADSFFANLDSDLLSDLNPFEEVSR